MYEWCFPVLSTDVAHFGAAKQAVPVVVILRLSFETSWSSETRYWDIL